LVRPRSHVYYFRRSPDGECNRQYDKGGKLGKSTQQRTLAFYSGNRHGRFGWILDHKIRPKTTAKSVYGQRLQGLSNFFS